MDISKNHKKCTLPDSLWKVDVESYQSDMKQNNPTELLGLSRFPNLGRTWTYKPHIGFCYTLQYFLIFFADLISIVGNLETTQHLRLPDFRHRTARSSLCERTRWQMGYSADPPMVLISVLLQRHRLSSARAFDCMPSPLAMLLTTG